MLCKDCKTPMKWLFSSMFCPKGCDLDKKPAAQEEKWTTLWGGPCGCGIRVSQLVTNRPNRSNDGWSSYFSTTERGHFDTEYRIVGTYDIRYYKVETTTSHSVILRAGLSSSQGGEGYFTRVGCNCNACEDIRNMDYGHYPAKYGDIPK